MPDDEAHRLSDGGPHAPVTLDRARRIAAHVTAGRAAVAQVYDRLAGRGPARRAADFKTLALGVTDPAEAAALALVAASQAGFLGLLLADLAEARLIDAAAAFAPDAAAMAGAGLAAAAATAAAAEGKGVDVTLLPQDASGHSINPQGLTPDMAATLRMAELVPGLTQAIRRVCLITVGNGQSQGTGFLIGPQTVLTNWHVMHSLIDPATGLARPGSARQITCLFENLAPGQGRSHVPVENWLVDFSPLQLGGAAVTGAYPDMTALRPHALDYCAIRLSGAPGRSRDYYRLAERGELTQTQDVLFVIQHPGAFPQVAGFGTGTVKDAAAPDFLRHFAPTAEGSSGGLCLDRSLRIIGLHQAEARGPANAFLFNRAVDVAAIHAANPRLGDPDPAADRAWLLQRDGRPCAVIGRERSQDRIRAMAAATREPILFLQGDARSGKSFTADLIAACVQPGRNLMLKLTPQDVGADPRALAALILGRLGAPASAVAALPSADAPDGTAIGWIRNDLFPAFSRGLSSILLADPASPRTLWLTFDDLDKSDILRTDARLFLDELYNAAQGLGHLRILLIGLGGLPGLNAAQAGSERLDPPDDLRREDIEFIIGALLTEHRIAAQPGEIARHADLALAAADALRGPAGGSRLAWLSQTLADVYLRAADRWT